LNTTPLPLQLFGEVLFDCFPDGRSVLGGAPFNVAWHLQAFGETPRLVSRVGADTAGEAVRRAMTDWGMDTGGLQTDPELPTGRVDVTIEDGEPRYDIVHPVAWDAIEPPPPAADDKGAGGGWLYHGSLALRDARARAALDALTGQGGVRIFVDINLREPWWDRDAALARVHEAHWVKLNAAELDALAPPGDRLSERARRLYDAAGLEGLIVTLGADGALVLRGDREVSAAPAAQRVAVTDTVGAGDAFSSVVLLGLRRGWPLEVMLERALAFAAAVCGLQGATVADPDFYQPFLHGWQEAGEGA
jgi:fructokinase